MRVAFAAAEFVPLAKSGGLGDACAALALYLDRAGHDVRVFLPLYRQARDVVGDDIETELSGVTLRLGQRSFTYNVRRYRLPGSGIDIRLIDCPELFDREWLYTPDDDEFIRFGMFSQAVLEYSAQTGWSPDIIHCHDWHAALVPAQRAAQYAGVASLVDARTLVTIHNIGFQGVFGTQVIDVLGLGSIAGRLDQDDLSKDRFNYLKTGLLFADAASTVSPTYAGEILMPEFGHGLEPTLASLARPVTGILNGIDLAIWNPAHDPDLDEPFSMLRPEGKIQNKVALAKRFGLDIDAQMPLVGIVTRLSGQKGIQLVVDTMPAFLQSKQLAFIALGSGEPDYERALHAMSLRFPGLVHFEKGYNEALAHQIYGSCDLTLVPSMFEPCGLTQMYSMRYGAIPIVRWTGGLADTVSAYDPASGAGLGFVFGPPTVEELGAAIERALSVYRDTERWRQLVRRAMSQDFSWDRPGAAYVDLYERLRQA